MPTTITMYKADDGTLCATLKDAIAHENAVFFHTGLTPLLARWLGLLAPPDTMTDSSLQATALVSKLEGDAALLSDLRKFFTKATPAANTAPVATKRVRPSRSRAKPGATPPAPDAPFKVVGDAPTDSQLEALSALAGDPIQLPVADDAPGDPPAPPAALQLAGVGG